MKHHSSRLYAELLRFSRILAGLLGASMMAGEMYRSWGQQRHLLYIMDDFLIGIPLVVMAVLNGRPTVVRQCALAAAFAAATAMLYGSFFTKLVDPLRPQSSNLGHGLLTTLVGLGFIFSIVGLIASLYAVSIPKYTIEESVDKGNRTITND